MISLKMAFFVKKKSSHQRPQYHNIELIRCSMHSYCYRSALLSGNIRKMELGSVLNPRYRFSYFDEKSNPKSDSIMQKTCCQCLEF